MVPLARRARPGRPARLDVHTLCMGSPTTRTPSSRQSEARSMARARTRGGQTSRLLRFPFSQSVVVQALPFAPTSFTVGAGIIAAGGQHGQVRKEGDEASAVPRVREKDRRGPHSLSSSSRVRPDLRLPTGTPQAHLIHSLPLVARRPPPVRRGRPHPGRIGRVRQQRLGPGPRGGTGRRPAALRVQQRLHRPRFFSAAAPGAHGARARRGLGRGRGRHPSQHVRAPRRRRGRGGRLHGG